MLYICRLLKEIIEKETFFIFFPPKNVLLINIDKTTRGENEKVILRVQKYA